MVDEQVSNLRPLACRSGLTSAPREALDRGVLVIRGSFLNSRMCGNVRGCARIWAQINICAQWRPGAALDILPGVSEKNVEIVRRIFEAWEAGDMGAMLAPFADDLVTRRLEPMVDPGTWHGVDGALEVGAEWMETFDQFTMNGEEFVDTGDRVVVRVRQEGRGGASGVPVEATFWFVYGVRTTRLSPGTCTPPVKEPWRTGTARCSRRWARRVSNLRPLACEAMAAVRLVPH